MQRFAKQPLQGYSIFGWRIGKGQLKPLKYPLSSTEMSDEDVCKLPRYWRLGRALSEALFVLKRLVGCIRGKRDMEVPQHGHVGPSRPRALSAVMAVICTVAMIAATFVTAPFAMANQDGGMRIEIDDSKSVPWQNTIAIRVNEKRSSVTPTNSTPLSVLPTSTAL